MENYAQFLAQSNNPDRVIPTLDELQGQVSSLNHSLINIKENYSNFFSEICWNRFGEVKMLKQSIEEMTPLLQLLSAKIERFDKE